MASPFHIFRKHQRAMLAVVGILCMIGFSIGGVGLLDNMSDRSGGGENPVVATAYGQTLRESDVAALQRRRGLAIRFLGAAIRSTLGELARFINPEDYLERSIFGPPTERSVVETWVLAEQARRLGMVVSDEAINDYLKRMTEDKVKPDVFREIVKSLQSSQPEVFDALRHELLALRLRDMSLRNVEATPAQRWDYYRRLNQQAVAEVLALPVENFAHEVSDPSDEELAAFFEAHKEREPRPDSPEPGFKVPKKAAFEVVIARFEEFNDPDSITEEEVKEFYEKNKDQRFLFSQHAFTDWDEEPAGESDKATDEKATEEKATDKKSGDEKATDEKATDKKASDEKAGDEKATDRNEADDEARANRALRPGLSNNAARLKTVIVSHAPHLAAAWHPALALTGWLAAEDEQPADEAASAATDANENAAPKVRAGQADQDMAAEDQSTIKKDAADKNAADKDAANKDDPDKRAAKKPKTKIPAIAPPITDELMLPRDVRKGENPKYAPLWKVERSIREQLAREKAKERIEQALQAIQTKMRQYSQRRLGSGKTPKLDLAKLAADEGFSQLQTGRLTAYELQEKHPDLAAARGEGSGINFLSIGYGTQAVYQSTIVQDTDANRYLFWKTDEEPAYVPEFAEIRSKVLRTWKLVQAREIAEKKARKLAEEAKQAGKPLQDLFGDQGTVTQTQPFSWMSRGSASPDGRGPLEVSDVEGVERPGADFMRETFSLGVGDVGEALNQPKTVAYLIRVTSLQPPRELLRSRFLASPFSLYAEAGTDDRRQIIESWRKGVEAEANLTWVKSDDDDAKR